MSKREFVFGLIATGAVGVLIVWGLLLPLVGGGSSRESNGTGGVVAGASIEPPSDAIGSEVDEPDEGLDASTTTELGDADEGVGGDGADIDETVTTEDVDGGDEDNGDSIGSGDGSESEDGGDDSTDEDDDGGGGDDDEEDDAGDPDIVIVGPGSVPCWGENHTYTAENSGGEIFDWNWDTGVGLQSRWYEGPEAVLSFDLGVGTYEIRVTANDSIVAKKSIIVTAAPGCQDGTPSPQIVGPKNVRCGTTSTYTIHNRSETEIDQAQWISTAMSISVSDPLSGAEVEFPSSPGLYDLALAVNDGLVSTHRLIDVTCP